MDTKRIPILLGYAGHCQQCGGLFKALQINKKTCSDACRTKMSRERRKQEALGGTVRGR